MSAESQDSMHLSRREAMFLSATVGMGFAMATRAEAMDSTKTSAHQEPGNCSTPSSAIANTQYGKVRGFVDGGVFTFKGIPYGQDTGGENRWLPAKPPKPWKDPYPALIYGANCPQNLHNFTAIEQSFLQDWDDGYMSEDMLKLNIWTPSLTGSRAVMVYFHGGGYSFGSSYELPSHEGAQMARHHDVCPSIGESPAQHSWILRCLGNRRRRLRRVGQRGHDRPGGVAQVGAGKHRELRRRSQ